MAHYHCSYGKCNKGRGSSAAAAYDYITRARKYKGKQGLLYFESGNVPEWCGGKAREYWYQADRNERANSNVCRKIEFALPAEVTDIEVQKQIVREVIEKACHGDRLMWSYAIHTTPTNNVHAHVLISERIQDGIVRSPDLFFRRANKKKPKKSGARKTNFLDKRDFVAFIRAQIAEIINAAYRRLGIDASVDHRSYAERGILKIPEAHRGPQLAEMEDRGIVSYVLAARREKIMDQQRALIADIEFERDGILADLKHLTDQLALWDRHFGKDKAVERPAKKNLSHKTIKQSAPVVRKETPKPTTTVKVRSEQEKKYKVNDDLRINVDLLSTVANDVDGDLMWDYESFVAQSSTSKDDLDPVDGDLMKESDYGSVPASTKAVASDLDPVDGDFMKELDYELPSPTPVEQRPVDNDWTDFDEDGALAPSSQVASSSAKTPSLTQEQLADRQYADKAVNLRMGEYEGTLLAYGEHDLYLRTAGGIIRIPRIEEKDVPRNRLDDYHAIYAPIGSHIHITYDAYGLYPVKGNDDDDQYLGRW